jgi:hypothetical protein
MTKSFSIGVIGAGFILGCSEAPPTDDASGGNGAGSTGGAAPSAGSGATGITTTGGVGGAAMAAGGSGASAASGGTGTGGLGGTGGAGGTLGPAGTGGLAGAGSTAGAGASGQPGGAGGQGGTGSGAGGAGQGSVQCYEIKARASAVGSKYSVPTTPDLYHCFNYDLPWGSKKVQIVSSRPLIDNMQVIHHWILYNTVDAVADGTNGSCSHPGAAFLTGWAPGGTPSQMPADVGLQVGGAGLTLEIHYNNTVGAGEQDGSGVELCVTEDLRPKEAAVHWLGTYSLNKIEATGTCTPTNQEPVTILGSSPHMHLQGRHMKTVINRKDGSKETLIDVAFLFANQTPYDTPATIYPGDTLTTTCTYAQPTPFGEGTNEEMCFNFVTAYPAGKMVSALSLQPNDCTGF